MIEKPKKERRFLKALGRVGEILIQEVLIKVGSSLIKRIGGKKQIPSILFLFLSISLYGQFPININKQRLGFQTTADGLVWRGSLSDTASIQPVSNQNAWVILDTVNLKIYSFDFTSNVWNQVGGSAFTQPVDSLFFDTSVSPNNVDTAKMRWDYELGTVVLGMYDQVPNEIGFKNFWLVKNQTGSTIAKGSIVYANGTVGASGRITVAKFIANGSIDAKYLLGITAHDLTDGEDGYVISFGKIRQVNTDTFADGAILYPSPTVAGVWTDVEPIAPNLDMPIGFCINSSSNNGTIAIRVASGYSINELHNVAISSPVEKSSLYYSGGLWRDTTAALLVSDTATMLANYATKAYADTTGRLYARQDYTTGVTTSTLTWTQTDTLIPGGVTFIQVYRNGQILLPSQYTVPTSTSVVILASSFKVNDNYTVIFPRGGGAGSGGGSGSLTSISGGTGITVSPNPITTTGIVSADTSFLFTQSDTLSLNLTSRFALKLNAADTASLSNRIDAKGTGTVTSVGSGFGLLGGTITTTGTLRLDTSTIYARLQDSINVAIGGDTIKILKQEYQPALSSVLTWTITPKFPIQLKAYILVFRNGQLLNNDQYNLTDTNQITIVSTSFKIGANYTVATVSGIGSVGSAQAGNPVYPEAGIALSTGSTWASSIPNNSSNWNTAYNDKINSLAVTGTTTKTITLTQQDGGTVSGNFADNGSVTSVDMTVPTGLAISGQPITTSGTLALSYASGYAIPTDIKQNEWNTAYNDKINNAAFTGTTTKTLTLTQLDGGTIIAPFTDLQGVTGSGTIGFIPKFSTTTEVTNSVIQESSGNIGIGVAPTSNLELAKGKFITLNSSGSPFQDSSGIMLYEVGTKTANDINFGAKIMYNGDSDNFEIKMKNFNGTTLFNPPVSISIPRVTGNVNIGTSLAVTGNITEGGNNVLTNLDTASLSTRIDAKLSPSDTVSLSNRIDSKVSLTGDQTIGGTKTFNNLVNITNQMTISGSVSGANILLGKNTSTNGVGDITLGTGLSLASNILTASGTDTSSLSDRINLKYNSSGGTISGAVTLSTTSATPTSLLGKDGSNVVGTVTTVAQTGLFGRGSVSNEITDANGNITVAHGFNFTPIMAFANLPGQTTNIINVKEVDGTNITFVVRDGATNDVRNTVTITKIEFFGIK